MRHEVFIDQLFRHVHLENVIQLLIGDIAVVLFIDLANGPHYMGQDVFLGQHVNELIPRNFHQLLFLAEEHSQVTAAIHDVLLTFVVEVDVLVELLHGLREVDAVEARDV